jgi:hypothetical protein
MQRRMRHEMRPKWPNEELMIMRLVPNSQPERQ